MRRKKTIFQLKKEVQVLFNSYIRARDSSNGFFTCISCNLTLPVKSMNCGHYFPVKGYNWLRFDPDNANGECQRCNGFDDAHLILYTWNLKKKLGDNRYNLLLDRAKNPQLEFTREELEILKSRYVRQKPIKRIGDKIL
jgi:hypothetical protein